jgi:hypothetical protein
MMKVVPKKLNWPQLMKLCTLKVLLKALAHLVLKELSTRKYLGSRSGGTQNVFSFVEKTT